MKQMNLFDNLKLRASYGEMGNQSGIGLYDYIQLITISGSTYPFGDGYKGQLAYPQNMTSLTRTWEKVTSANLGLDLAVLNSRLNGSVEYFRKQNRNMLIPVTYPSVLGTTAPYTNNGRLDVHGWELSIGWSDKVNDFSYAVRLSVSDSKNKVVEKGGSDSFNLGLNTTRKGYPINSYFGYAFDGIIKDEADLEAYKQRFPNGGIPGNLAVGDAKYKDLDNDGKLSLYNEDGSGAGDAVYLGDQNPRYSFGFNSMSLTKDLAWEFSYRESVKELFSSRAKPAFLSISGGGSLWSIGMEEPGRPTGRMPGTRLLL